jgi:hypothetical protein
MTVKNITDLQEVDGVCVIVSYLLLAVTKLADSLPHHLSLQNNFNIIPLNIPV